jgi:hypothetical protein
MPTIVNRRNRVVFCGAIRSPAFFYQTCWSIMVHSRRVIAFRVTGRASQPSALDFERALDDEKVDEIRQLGDSEKIARLNRISPMVAREIEKTVLMMLPPEPEIVVEADVQFRSGSVILIATITVLNWAGSVALDNLRAQLSEIIGVAVQRVVNRALARIAPNLSPMECTVAERLAGPVATPHSALTGPWTLPAGNAWFNLLVVALFLIALLLFLDQVVGITSERGSQSSGQNRSTTLGLAQ